MKIRLIIYSILIYTFTTSACIRNHLILNDKYVQQISQDDFSGYLVVKISRNDIRVVNNQAFRNVIYDQHYYSRYFTYKLFLRALFDNKVNDLHKYTLVNNTISSQYYFIHKEYKKNGLNYIIDKYLTKREDVYVFKENNENAIFEIMFYNGFYIFLDDYTGIYFFSPRCHTNSAVWAGKVAS